MMLSDREIIRDLAVIHVEGEGDWCLAVDCDHAGEDDE